MEALQAILQFFVDLFSALSTFLTGEGGAFDISGLLSGLTNNTEDTSSEQG